MLARVRSILDALFRRQRLEEGMDAELRSHIEARADDLVRSGVPRAEAERCAHVEFGGLEAVKEECREARGLRWPDELRQDLHYAFRSLRKAPGFTLAAVSSLAFGIGANTAIFSVVNAALMRPLPYRDPARLVAVYEDDITRGEKFEDLAIANFIDLRAGSSSFEDLAAHMPEGLSLVGTGDAEQLDGRLVSANMFLLLGVHAQLGRTLRADDGDLGSPRVILLSYTLWQQKFGGDPAIVGRTLRLEGNTYTVIGVMPEQFRFPGARDECWLPFRWDAADRQQRSNHNLGCIGRLKGGASLRQAQTEASFIAQRLERQYPEDNAGVDYNLVPLRESLTQTVHTALIVLLSAVGLLLLIACANVGNLILTRSTVRRRELAVRAALGAGRWRLVRQTLTESICLAVLGCAGALALCFAIAKALRTSLPPALIPAGDIRLDTAVLSFGLLVSIAAGLLCGLAPAMLVAGGNLRESLLGWSRSSTGSRKDVAARSALVVSEVSLTLVLLIGAGLLLRSFVRLMDVDPGINPGHVLAARFVLPSFLYPSQQTRVPFYQRLLERIESVPGVRSAALITKLPIASQGGSSWFIRENRPALHPEELLANNRLVSEGYFRTLGIPLRAGRAFSSHDGADAPLVAVINETMARKFWPGENPIGLRFRFYDKPWVQIVGIVGDVRQAALDADPLPEIYRPFVQDGQSWLAPRALVIRAQGDPLAPAPAVHREFQALDRAVPVYGLDSMDALLGQSVASRKLEVMLVGAFGSLALLLASIGIYGVVSYAVARRGQEIGIRMALGATRADVMLMMLHKALRPVIIGLSIGLLLAFELSRFLASELFRVEATDALTFSVVPLLMAAIAASAALLPSRRAARIDPALALRHD